MVKIWAVVVQDLRKPFSFDKVKVLKEVDCATAQNWYERSIKHVHIHKCVVWAAQAVEKELGVASMTYLFFEGLAT